MTAELETPPPATEPAPAPVPAPRGNCTECEGRGYSYWPARTNPRYAMTHACGKCHGTGTAER